MAVNDAQVAVIFRLARLSVLLFVMALFVDPATAVHVHLAACLETRRHGVWIEKMDRKTGLERAVRPLDIHLSPSVRAD